MTYVFVISTYGSNRTDKFSRLINSIKEQSSPSWNILIVHVIQGRECLYFDIGRSIQHPTLRYIGSSDLGVGLSRGRNIALDILKDEKIDLSSCMVFFSDDDCFYPSNFIKIFRRIQDGNHNMAIAGLVLDETGSYALSYSSEKGRHAITKRRIFRNISSINFGVPYDDTRFDETFGIGGDFNSCEEFDYIFRRLSNGLEMRYDSNLFVYHPDIEFLTYNIFLSKVFYNSIGHGAYFRKHFGLESIYYVFFNPLLSILKNLILLSFKNSLASFIGFFGRIYGFYKFSNRH